MPEDFPQREGSDQIDEGSSKGKVGVENIKKATVKSILKTSKEQKEFLNNFYSKKKSVTKADREYIHQKTGISEYQIRVWFSNRRRDERQQKKCACNEECAKLKNVNKVLTERIEIMERNLTERIAIMEGNYGWQQDSIRTMWRKMREMMIVNNRHRFASWHWADETAKMLAGVSSPLSDLPDLE